MKTSILIIALLCTTLVVGISIHLNWEKQASPASPEPAAKRLVAKASPVTFRAAEAPSFPEPDAKAAAQASTTISRANDDSESGTNPAPQPTLFSRAIETLVSPQASFQQKQKAWRQLQETGQLEQVIEVLKRDAAENPGSPAYPAALGQAQLYRAGELGRKGGTISELGILGMQADQSFDAALKLDPSHWEAQFFKAAAMSHWPLELNKGEEVIQRLSSLIDQQDTIASQPQFAQSYVLLGGQYEKMGQPDHAAATWLLGAQKFPGNQELQQKLKGN